MSNIIYYFTDTGNSLAFARYVAENLDGETKIVSIADCIKYNRYVEFNKSELRKMPFCPMKQIRHSFA